MHNGRYLRTGRGLLQSLRVIAARPAVLEVLFDPKCRWKEFAAAVTIISPGWPGRMKAMD
jgi:hypothetical protein